MLASTSEASARPARPSERPSVEVAAAAAAGAATDLVVCDLFGVLFGGAVWVGFVFGEVRERTGCSAVRAVGSSRAAAVELRLPVDATEELGAFVEACVVDAPDGAASG